MTKLKARLKSLFFWLPYLFTWESKNISQKPLGGHRCYLVKFQATALLVLTDM